MDRCNTIYKVITKIIANHLKKFFEKFIRPLRSSFFKGRTADNGIIIQEVIHYMNHSKNKDGSFVLKIDFEKASDKLEWSFIYQILAFYKILTKLSN